MKWKGTDILFIFSKGDLKQKCRIERNLTTWKKILFINTKFKEYKNEAILEKYSIRSSYGFYCSVSTQSMNMSTMIYYNKVNIGKVEFSELFYREISLSITWIAVFLYSDYCKLPGNI